MEFLENIFWVIIFLIIIISNIRKALKRKETTPEQVNTNDQVSEKSPGEQIISQTGNKIESVVDEVKEIIQSDLPGRDQYQDVRPNFKADEQVRPKAHEQTMQEYYDSLFKQHANQPPVSHAVMDKGQKKGNSQEKKPKLNYRDKKTHSYRPEQKKTPKKRYQSGKKTPVISGHELQKAIIWSEIISPPKGISG